VYRKREGKKGEKGKGERRDGEEVTEFSEKGDF
jgi:hypothetical protein